MGVLATFDKEAFEGNSLSKDSRTRVSQRIYFSWLLLLCFLFQKEPKVFSKRIDLFFGELTELKVLPQREFFSTNVSFT